MQRIAPPQYPAPAATAPSRGVVPTQLPGLAPSPVEHPTIDPATVGRGGDAHYIQAVDYPLAIAAGATARTRIESSEAPLWHWVKALIWLGRTTAGAASGRHTRHLAVFVRLRDISAHTAIVPNWVPIEMVAGSTRWPGAMNWAMPGTTDLEIELRNDTSQPIEVFLEAIVARQQPEESTA